MKSLWSDSDARKFKGDLGKRVYTSRLLGADPALVLHGGGNTSVKITEKDFFGESTEILYVKGSGWDLGTIEDAGFAPVRMETLLKMAELKELSDADMVTHQRAAMLNPNAPTPSIEAIVHAVIPIKFVDHTHSDAVVALTNNKEGAKLIESTYGDRMIVIPYVMPGFELALAVHKAIQKAGDLSKIDGMILMNHGIFTWGDDAKSAYELMIKHVSAAEKVIKKASSGRPPKAKPQEDLAGLAAIRAKVSEMRGAPVYVHLDQSPEAIGFSNLKNVAKIATRGPLTPDHVIRTKRVPVVFAADLEKSLDQFADNYEAYFKKHTDGNLTMLDPAPRWGIWPGHGILSFGVTEKETGIIADIVSHTWPTIATVENAFGGWKALPADKIFAIEYWELEQAKLKKSGGAAPIHQGKVALVTGSAAGIGFACAASLAEQGAKVIGLDLNPDIVDEMAKIGGIGKIVNLTDDKKVIEAVESAVRDFGGIDIVVSNAGIFTAGAYLEDLEARNWDLSIAVNLTSHQKLLKYTIPYLHKGKDPAVVLVGSRNVNAPGAGAASYSCAKAGLTQLCRVAALELAPKGVRCNIIHPDAVFDTKLWTKENLERSAERYNMTVEEYKTRNLLKTEIKSKNIGDMVAAMASPLFGKTTGAQVPVDGGNDRVI